MIGNVVVDPGIDEKFVADDVRGVQSLRKRIGYGFVVDVVGGSGEAGFVDGGANVFRREIEVASEFDFFVTGGGDFRERAGRIGLHELANRVQLDADAADLVSGTPEGGGQGRDDCGG